MIEHLLCAGTYAKQWAVDLDDLEMIGGDPDDGILAFGYVT